jgi:hypothetical protein
MSIASRPFADYNLDRESGSGSTHSDEDEEDSEQAETGWDSNWNQQRRGTFNYRDEKFDWRKYSYTIERFGEEYDKWDWLNQLDNGVRDPQWNEVKRSHFHRTAIEILCGQLQCSDYQQLRVKHLFDKVDGGRLGSTSYEEVIMALITLVQNEDVGIGGKDVRDRDRWATLVDDIESDERTIRKLRSKYHSLL